MKCSVDVSASPHQLTAQLIALYTAVYLSYRNQPKVAGHSQATLKHLSMPTHFHALYMVLQLCPFV